jgi:Tfp pilus assembly protein PilF
MRKTLLLLAAVMLLAGCESAPIKDLQEKFSNLVHPNPGGPDLTAGIRAYENGNYTESARNLNSALDAGLNRPNQIQAHKYLAFIHCVSARMAQCRDQFRKALTVDPDFELEPAEAGHPIWGPVFVNVKARR